MTLHQFLVRPPSWAEWVGGALAMLAAAIGVAALGGDVPLQAVTSTAVILGFFALVFLRRREADHQGAAARATTVEPGREVTWRKAWRRAPSLIELLAIVVALWVAVVFVEAADLVGWLEMLVFVGAFLVVTAAFTLLDKVSGGRWRPTER